MTLILNKIQEPSYILGTAFYGDTKALALRAAKAHIAGEGGHTASLSELVRGRIAAPFDTEIWNNGYTPQTEEDVGLTKQGNPVLAVSQGTGIFISPERIEKAYQDKLINGAGRIDPEEFQALLEGKLPDSTQIPVFTLVEFQRASNLPLRYVVVMDLEKAINTKSDYHKIDNLRSNPLFHVRAGGEAQANVYLDKVAEKWNTKQYGNYFAFNDPNTASGRLLYLYLNDFNGFSGSNFLDLNGSFVAVAPEAQTSVARDLGSAGKPKEEPLESIVKSVLQAGRAFSYNGTLYVPTKAENLQLSK